MKTDSDMQCRGFQFELNKEYSVTGKVKLCSNGFHFCEVANHCFNYYDFNSSKRVFEVEAWGDIDKGDDKSCTQNIRLVKEVLWAEVLNLVNTGTGNVGRDNAGNRNAGNYNAGNYNAGNYNAGAFCTAEPKYKLFNKESDWSFEDFKNSRAFNLLHCVDTTLYVPSSNMTEEEKSAHPYYETTGHYIKQIPFKEAFQNAWHNWSKANREAFTSLPNFSWDVFTSITGVQEEVI